MRAAPNYEQTKSEIWKDIPGFEGIYQVSNLGRVKALSVNKKWGRYNQIRPERIMLPEKNKIGYPMIWLGNSSKKRFHLKVHRLVALAFISNPVNKPCVNHINSIRNDNRVENLEWCTFKENIHHSIRVGTQNHVGENNLEAKITASIVKEIRCKYIPRVYTISKLSKEYGLGTSQITRIVNRKSWKHVA